MSYLFYNRIKFMLVAMLALSIGLLSGCAATQTAISKRNLDVQTKRLCRR